ncbi:hypothetical protein NC651_008141 [Populus alba x Populus x berolinensis]|nr:hypothetical protein NC651_008141 [Populus alba x Populus x berolinensis]
MFLVVEAIVDKIYSSIGHSTCIAPNVSFMLFQKLNSLMASLSDLMLNATASLRGFPGPSGSGNAVPCGLRVVLGFLT